MKNKPNFINFFLSNNPYSGFFLWKEESNCPSKDVNSIVLFFQSFFLIKKNILHERLNI
jgi:hypothetical protein